MSVFQAMSKVLGSVDFTDSSVRSTLLADVSNSTSSIRAWSRNVTKFPGLNSVNPNLRSGYRMGHVGDSVVRRVDLLAGAKTMYDTVKFGEVKQLVAGTGAGKSTLIPVVYATSNATVGIVVSPTFELAKLTAEYTKTAVAIGEYQQCQIITAVDYHDTKQARQPSVVYMSAPDFLMLCATRPGVLKDGKFGYVCVDEAHEKFPEYPIIRHLARDPEFSSVKVFLASATSGDTAFETRPKEIKHNVNYIKQPMLAYRNIDNLNSDSPLHWQNIVSRTIIFVATSDDYKAMSKYYTKQDIQVKYLNEGASYKEIVTLMTFLKLGSHPIVVLLTQFHQTGFTFDVDVVIDCGVSVALFIDTNTHNVSLLERKVAKYERTQRAGRVGRHLSGLAYGVQGDVDDMVEEIYEGYQIYFALWANVLGLSLNSNMYTDWAPMLRTLSIDQQVQLLCLRLNPRIALAFYDETAKTSLAFGQCVRSLVNTVNLDTLIPLLKVAKYRGFAVDEESWVPTKYKSGSLCVTFYSPFVYPRTWEAWFMQLFLVYSGAYKIKETPSATSSVASSVASTRHRRHDSGVSVRSEQSRSSKLSTKEVAKHNSARREQTVKDARMSAYLNAVAVEELPPLPISTPGSPSSTRSSRSGISRVNTINTFQENLFDAQSGIFDGDNSDADVFGKPQATSYQRRQSNASTSSAAPSRRPPLYTSASVYGSSETADHIMAARALAEHGSPRRKAREYCAPSLSEDLSTIQSSANTHFTSTVAPAHGLDGPVFKQQSSSSAGSARSERDRVTFSLSKSRRSQPDSFSEDHEVVYESPAKSNKLRRLRPAIRADRLVAERIFAVESDFDDQIAEAMTRVGTIYTYKDLKRMEKSIGRMSLTDMREAHVKCIATWNVTCSEAIQLGAKPINFITTFMHDRDVQKCEVTKQRCIVLLTAFEFHGMEVALYPKQLHSGYAVDWQRLDQHRLTAGYILRLGSDALRQAVAALSPLICVHYVAAKRVAVYMKFGNSVYGVLHAFVTSHDGIVRFKALSPRYTDVVGDSEADLVKMSVPRDAYQLSVVPRFRAAVQGESVLVLSVDARSVPQVYGPYTILSANYAGTYDAVLYPGMSGSPLLALTDGYIVGLHIGVPAGAHGGVSSFGDGQRCKLL